MNLQDLADLAVHYAEDLAVYGNEAEVELPTGDLEELVEVRNRCQQLSRALRAIGQHIENEMTVLIGTGAARYGDDIYRVYGATRYTGTDALAKWIAGGDEAVAKRIAAVYSTVRVTGVRAVAEDEGLDPTAAVDTFLRVDKEPVKLHAMPVHRAPKWLQRLTDGDKVD